jgi:hypothetical protein
LLDDGFIPSAKHDFQLLRQLQVGHRQFVFNVDLLHSDEQFKTADLFQDVFDLGLTDDNDPTGKRWIRSVVFRSSKVLLDNNLWSPVVVAGNDCDMRYGSVSIPLLDETALIVSKLQSVQQVKRQRDSYDIFYVVEGPKKEEIRLKLQFLVAQHPEIVELISSFRKWLDSNHSRFNANVERYARTSVPSAATTMCEFLDAIGRQRSV